MALLRLLYDLLQLGLKLEDGQYIKLGTFNSLELVIYVGELSDGAASGFSPGSLALDPTNGLVYYADSSAVWQSIAAA